MDVISCQTKFLILVLHILAEIVKFLDAEYAGLMEKVWAEVK